MGLSSGLRPDEFWDLTFKELSFFTSSIIENEKLEWRRHSYLLAILANQNRPKGKSPVKADDLYPFDTDKPAVTKDEIQGVIDHLRRPRKRKK